MSSGHSAIAVWAVILLLGAGTYALRASFLGPLGRRPFPEWALRLLRYTPVAVLPALIAPATVWPAATDGQPDPARLLAAAATVIVGAWTRSALPAMTAGLATLYTALWLIG